MLSVITLQAMATVKAPLHLVLSMQVTTQCVEYVYLRHLRVKKC